MRVYDVPEELLDNPDIAVVGMAARLPGANDVFELWHNLDNGRESIRRLSDEELARAGVDSATLHDPNYVKAAAILDRLELFDASFFGFSKREAEVLDPQHRHFLEVCVEALESAGIQPAHFDGSIGLFAGSGMNAYLPYNLFTNPDLMRSMGLFLVRHTGNDKDFLTTRVSYCLNLKGPSVNVQTACSTSLVAIHLACQSLLSGECDVALAGGVTIELPHYRGYRYEEGEILSPDGHCRPFDAKSRGTVFGSGAGIVVLRRLRDAVERGDYIHAVVKGSAINNDGNRKVGYLAPSVDGQAECIVEALEVAGLSARDISYVECHGTGTPVGDPIEVAALTQAFSRWTTDKNFCGLGSLKSNIGHLDTAAGVASFIKVAEMLDHEKLAPTLHFEKPNPQIDFLSTPFQVISAAKPWPRTETPRRAGVSSLGVGGTNAHVILEEAPRRRRAPQARTNKLLIVSARSASLLDAACLRLARHMRETPNLELAEVSSTLLRDRTLYPFRRVLSARGNEEARHLLESADKSCVFDACPTSERAEIVYLFPGGGAQYANMARELYESEPVFRRALDECFEILICEERLDLKAQMFCEAGDLEQASRRLERPSLALPAILAVEIAYARLLESCGVVPVAMLGHSLGEYAAAHLANVFSLREALGIVCCRGRLFETVDPGGMLSVPLGRADVEKFLDARLSIAAVNAPELCVVSGDYSALDALEQRLASSGIEARRLHIDVAAHSPLLEPILREFRTYLAKIKFSEPERPYVSNLTGEFVRKGELCAEYFVRHLRSTVRFSDGLETLLAKHPSAILVEVGPGQALSSLVRQHPARKQSPIIPVCPHAKAQASDSAYWTTSVGRILAHGGTVNIDKFLGDFPRRVVPLPPTPFEHQRYWVEPGSAYFMAPNIETNARETDLARWFYAPVFREEPRAPATVVQGERWLVMIDDGPLARALGHELKARGIEPIFVYPGEQTERKDASHFSLRLSDPQAYDDILQRVISDSGPPRRILHAFCLGGSAESEDLKISDAALDRAFFSLLHLAQVLANEELGPGIELLVATLRAESVAGTSTLRPLHALTRGPVLVIPKEIPEISARNFDLLSSSDVEETARTLVSELSASSTHAVVAERAHVRYVQAIERTTLDDAGFDKLPPNPVVVFTGGLGGIARTLALHFANTRGARIALISRSGLIDPTNFRAQRAKVSSEDPLAEQLDTLCALGDADSPPLLLCADVTVESELLVAMAKARAHFGRIDLVVHAAGTLDDGVLALKSRTSARTVLAPKVEGALNVARALKGDPDAMLLLISSTSATLGPPGQIDYVAANAYLNALGRMLSLLLPRNVVKSLAFGAWKDTGMAVRVTKPFARRPNAEPTAHPLLRTISKAESGRFEFFSNYDTTLWVLDEHRVRGVGPVLPGTSVLEIARAAGVRALGLSDNEPLEIRDVMLLAPLEVPERETRSIHVTATPDDSNPGSYLIAVESKGLRDEAPTEHARAIVSRASRDRAAPLSIAELEARCRQQFVEFEEGAQVLPQDQHLAFGPRWKVIRNMRFGTNEALATLALRNEHLEDLHSLPLHPAVLDIASGFAFSLADSESPGELVRVPLSYQHVRVFAPLSQNLVSFARLKPNQTEDGISVFDVWIADPSGRVLIEISGYTTKSVAPGTLHGKSRTLRREPTLLERWVEDGIRREEGARIVDLVLRSSAGPELIASPTSIYAMLEAVQPKHKHAKASEPTDVHEATTRNAPRDDIERKLAEMWQSLLGVEKVGIHDNFFELGGHSLIAVRLFSRIKKTYGVDLSLAVLFQAPTIDACAAILRKELGIAPAATPVESSKQANGSSTVSYINTFRALVQIQKGSGKTPFFCVHGAGGNVLNFRSLALGLGSEQPFYGLQARGVDGQKPAETIEEMADIYLPELRAVQPHGPYLLGGYSGGGVVAYELAQRLSAQGEEVLLLAFLDTFHPATKGRRPSLAERMEKLLQEGPGYISRTAKATFSRQFGELSSELKLRFFLSQDLPLPLELRDLQLSRAFFEAAERYTPKPYDGKVTLFRARTIADIYKHVGPMLGWDSLIPNLEVVEVPGNHDSLVLEPNVQVLTKHLRSAIAKATQKPVSATWHTAPPIAVSQS